MNFIWLHCMFLFFPRFLQWITLLFNQNKTTKLSRDTDILKRLIKVKTWHWFGIFNHVWVQSCNYLVTALLCARHCEENQGKKGRLLPSRPNLSISSTTKAHKTGCDRGLNKYQGRRDSDPIQLSYWGWDLILNILQSKGVQPK